MNRIQLLSPLSPAECASRLTAAIVSDYSSLPSLAGMFGSKPVIGRVTESTLRLRKRIGYQNSFQRYLTATLRSEAGGTVISGKVAMSPFVTGFMCIWFGGVIVIGGIIFSHTISTMLFGTGSHQQGAWIGLIVPPGMLFFGFGLIRFGGYLARNETRFLTDFLIKTLNAHAVPPADTLRVEQ